MTVRRTALALARSILVMEKFDVLIEAIKSVKEEVAKVDRFKPLRRRRSDETDAGRLRQDRQLDRRQL